MNDKTQGSASAPAEAPKAAEKRAPVTHKLPAAAPLTTRVVAGTKIESGIRLPLNAVTSRTAGKWKSIVESLNVGDSFLFARDNGKRANSASYQVKQQFIKQKRKELFVQINRDWDRVYRINDDGTIPDSLKAQAEPEAPKAE